MRSILSKFIMVAKKTVAKKKVVATQVEVPPAKFVKGPYHIVKDGEVILDPNFVNPGVFSSKA